MVVATGGVDLYNFGPLSGACGEFFYLGGTAVIQVQNLSKAYGAQVLFDGISFSLSPGERLGLVGRNGSGKSTIIKLVIGEEHADQGQIVFPKGYRIGYLSQHLKFNEATALREAALGLPLDEREQEYRAAIILSGLGFSEADMQRPPQIFSGGFQIRLELARVLLSQPNLLLLDEPTNYLDIVSVRWLEGFLAGWESELILISHDRTFMDKVTNSTMLIRRAGIKKISGNTGQLYAQVAQEEEIYEQTRNNLQTKKREMEEFITRFRAKATKAAVVQSRVKALERMGDMQELQQEEILDFKFRAAPMPGKIIMEAKKISFAYPNADASSAFKPLISGLDLLVAKGDRIGIVGKNGVGKSTLLRLLANELTPVAGEIRHSPNAAIGYFGQTNILRLDPKLTVEQEIFNENQKLSRTETRNICGTMMFSGDHALKKISVLSGGEKSRVLIGKILARPSNLLLLDEPTNHLDQESIATMIESLKEYEGAVVIVTHNELILRELANKLVVFQGDSPFVFNGNYDYFLEKIGWDDEARAAPSKTRDLERAQSSKSKPAAPQLDRRERAQLRQERSQVLKPLEAKIKRLEDEICALEEQIALNSKELVEASTANLGDRIASLGYSLAVAKRRIDECFTALEPIVSEYDKIKAEFDTRLGQG